MASPLLIANNTFANASSQAGYTFMVVQGDTSNITIQNETINGGSFDNLYQIQQASYLNISNISVMNFSNPARTSSGTSLFRMYIVENNITVNNINVTNSSMNYGSLVEIDQAITANI